MTKRFFIFLFYIGLLKCSMIWLKSPKYEQFVNHCYVKGFKFENNDVVFINFPKQLPRAYILRNKTKFTVVVDRDYEQERPGASAGWMSHIDTENASALVLGKQNVSFKCLRKRNNQWVTANCQQVLQICQKPLKSSEIGSYWLVENKPQKGIWEKFDHIDFFTNSQK